MNWSKMFCRIAPVTLAAALTVLPSPSAATGLGGDVETGRISLGGRAAYYMPEEGDNKWYGGAQLRFHLTPVWALEGSVDYRRQNLTNASRLDVFPVQASLIGYILPGSRISPFVLAGGGWYFTHIKNAPTGVDDTQNRFGPHVGAGVQFFLTPSWSIDTTYRYAWIEDISSKDASLLDKDFRDRGHQVTAGLNYHFPVR